MVEHRLRKEGEEAVLALSGRLGIVDERGFRGIIGEVAALAPKSLVVDLEGLSFVDSAGMGLMVLLADWAAQGRVEMRVRGLDGQVKRAFQIFNFDGLFTLE